jgi:hypothetical protein
MEKGELGEVGKWKKKALSSKGGTVLHSFSELGDKFSQIKKSCGHSLGERCDCKKSIDHKE